MSNQAASQCDFYQEGSELRRDRIEAERLAKRWPGMTPEQIIPAVRAKAVELGRQCRAMETEAGLL